MTIKLEITEIEYSYLCMLLQARMRHTHEVVAVSIFTKLEEQRKEQ